MKTSELALEVVFRRLSSLILLLLFRHNLAPIVTKKIELVEESL